MMPRQKTVVFAHGGGRFGNQFLRFLHWLAWATENQPRVRIVDMAFWPYAPLFDVWSEYPGCVYPNRQCVFDRVSNLIRAVPHPILRYLEWRLQRLTSCVARVLPGVGSIVVRDGVGEPLLLDDRSFSERETFVVCSGWRISAWDALERQEINTRLLMRPSAQQRMRAAETMGPLRRKYDVLVGLFIRRGDYREWAEGRFYYPWQSYVRWTEELCTLFPGRRVGVLLAGDELLPLDRWSHCSAVPASGTINAGGHWFESFVELAACDYVVSAPSTFAACAAYLGNVPIWPLVSPQQILSHGQLLKRHIFDATRHPQFSIAVN